MRSSVVVEAPTTAVDLQHHRASHILALDDSESDSDIDILTVVAAGHTSYSLSVESVSQARYYVSSVVHSQPEKELEQSRAEMWESRVS